MRIIRGYILLKSVERRTASKLAVAAMIGLALADVAAAQAPVSIPPPAPPVSVTTAVPLDPKLAGSLYLQCDGNPNNMSAGEGLARFVGAVTLLALFAPAAETPDASKRKFGEDGVKACSGLIDGDKAEGTVVRRLPLILARALHRIEAKDYAGALSDVAKAREESAKFNLASDPYFQRSMGVSFNLIQAETHLRMGKAELAQSTAFQSMKGQSYSYYPIVASRDFAEHLPTLSENELTRLTALARLSATYQWLRAYRLSEGLRFAESAAATDDAILWSEAFKQEDKSSFPNVAGAIAHALAGNWPRATELAARGRTNLETRRAEGKAEEDASSIVEMLDFYDIIQLVRDGKVKDARRNFAARSKWLAPAFGQVQELNRRLRVGAAPEELFGALERTPDAMFAERRDQRLATMLQLDKNNRTLFSMILPYASVEAYERLSKRVWKTTGNALIGKKPNEVLSAYSLSIYDGDSLTQVDALLLHAALQAKARGKTGFAYFLDTQRPSASFVRFGNAGEEGIPASKYIPADDVIAELRHIIPPPEEVELRKARRAKAAK